MLRVGVIDYINSLPFSMGLERGVEDVAAELHFGHPAKLNQMLVSGELDASFMSFGAFLDQRDLVQALAGPCIGAMGPALSVNLYHEMPLGELSGVEIQVSEQTASTRALARVLCQHFWKVDPIFIDRKSHAGLGSAYLLIGDEALKHQKPHGMHCIDLAQAWYYATGLPFTFAIFAARKEAVAKKPIPLQAFRKALKGALDWSRKNQEVIISEASQQSGLTPDFLQHYFELLKFEETELSQKGKYLFAELWELTASLGASV